MGTGLQTFIAYHGNQAEKDAILAQLAAHREADEIINGQYWEHGKGCAVGCTVHSGKHAEYEPRFGIPVQIAYLEDDIFEALYQHDPVLAKAWPERVMGAITPGADLSKVWAKFVIWLLVDPTDGVLQVATESDTVTYIKAVAAFYENPSEATEKAVEAAWAARAARAALLLKQADKLIELLTEAKS